MLPFMALSTAPHCFTGRHRRLLQADVVGLEEDPAMLLCHSAILTHTCTYSLIRELDNKRTFRLLKADKGSLIVHRMHRRRHNVPNKPCRHTCRPGSIICSAAVDTAMNSACGPHQPPHRAWGRNVLLPSFKTAHYKVACLILCKGEYVSNVASCCRCNVNT